MPPHLYKTHTLPTLPSRSEGSFPTSRTNKKLKADSREQTTDADAGASAEDAQRGGLHRSILLSKVIFSLWIATDTAESRVYFH
ncbi:hypothetical protein EVAR_10787_1 [Eumeta japonica]|uniref:Uncharacterized protein n=1 Tax=Eumeta variegata TaxID=151549 RepID=A0A4C1W8I3_EUMVA|nr:hypothetical protein EVAR_10787_1 [Eumeta japonica]